ncbi:hypothetical protein RCC89_09480 [Cytophagaceae bacterium ABcell3]|nr:hypothetical protein RCC89_09480 [Cytophagaceae bacterium ABcell3]
MENILLVEVIFSLFVAAIITGTLYIVFKTVGPWGRAWAVFLVLFLAMLAVSEWFVPVGPSAWGFYWLPGLLAAVILGFLLAATSPSGRKKFPRNDEDPRKTIRPESYYSTHAAEPDGHERGDDSGRVVTGTLFWIFVGLLGIVAVVGIIT